MEDKLKERETYLDESNKRLKDASLSKIQTTMIGALDAIESEMSEYSQGVSDSEKVKLNNLFVKIRSRILDNGNNQKRLLTEEFKHYIIDWKKYTLVMPVKPRNRGEI